jgi:WXG100 family type VII secretion target
MMHAPVVQVRYDELDQIAARFGQLAERNADLERRLQYAFRPLEEGGWIGRGADAFSQSMRGEVFPACQRLHAALAAAREVTMQIQQIFQGGEAEAAALFQGGGTPTQINQINQTGTTLAELVKLGAKAAWKLFTNRKRIRGYIEGVRFVSDKNGIWRITGSQAAKMRMGLAPNLTRIGPAAIKAGLAQYSVWENMKNVGGAILGKGSFTESATKLLKGITEKPPLTAAMSFKDRLKGSAIVSAFAATASNIYEFGWGEQKDVGLFSRQFASATAADVSAGVGIGVGIVATSTLIGSAIPIPGVGTAAGFLVGMGLQYAYDTYAKDAWRNTVDQAAERVQSQFASAANSVSQISRDVSRAVHDTAHQMRQSAQILTTMTNLPVGTNLFQGALRNATIFRF